MKLRELMQILRRFEKTDPDIEVVVGGIHRGGTHSFTANHVFTEMSLLTRGPVLKISSHEKD